jgi:Cu+-exporting ATPase
VKDAGYELILPKPEEKTVLQITGMHCAGCVNSVEKALSNVEGVQSVNVSLSVEKAYVTWDSHVGSITRSAGCSRIGRISRKKTENRAEK